MIDDSMDEYWGFMVFGVGLLLMGMGKLFKQWVR
jgi:hypothetical protein